MTDLTGLSYSELRESAAAIQREVERREALDQAQRDEQFRAELDQVRAGTRRVDSEHIVYLTPTEVETAIDRGQLIHQGIGPDRRKSRR